MPKKKKRIPRVVSPLNFREGEPLVQIQSRQRKEELVFKSRAILTHSTSRRKLNKNPFWNVFDPDAAGIVTQLVEYEEDNEVLKVSLFAHDSLIESALQYNRPLALLLCLLKLANPEGIVRRRMLGSMVKAYMPEKPANTVSVLISRNLEELVNLNLIAVEPGGLIYLNPHYVYRGDRAATWRAVQRKEQNASN